MNKEFIKNFKKNRIDIQYSDFEYMVENLLMNIKDEENEVFDLNLKDIVILWKILKKNLKKDERW